jgi:hypothetical protein
MLPFGDSHNKALESQMLAILNGTQKFEHAHVAGSWGPDFQVQDSI